MIFFKLFKVEFENMNWNPVYVVAKSFDDAAEEVRFQIASTQGFKPEIKSVEVLAAENGLYKNLKLDSVPKLYLARSLDEEG